MQQNGLLKICLVDDESLIRDSLSLLLSDKYDVDSYSSAEEAIKVFLEKAKQDLKLPDIILLDVMMPGIDGISALSEFKNICPSVPVIMLTASRSIQDAVKSIQGGACSYLEKPYDPEVVFNEISKSLKTENLKQKNSKRETKRVFIGSSDISKKLLEDVLVIADIDASVLITGESGTGKEVIARTIHENSKRSKNAFIAINCAAIPETLIESELFGHEEGAFTSAVAKRIGLFELADGGTLFLDEIGELGLNTQVKLLRFLQESEFYRVGASKPISINTRIVCATNKNLEEQISSGQFREDLYYRINVIGVEIPPLRDRKEDVEELFYYLVEKHSKNYDNKKLRLTNEAKDLLINYKWPGNVRELENLCENLLALNQEPNIKAKDLPLKIRERS